MDGSDPGWLADYGRATLGMMEGLEGYRKPCQLLQSRELSNLVNHHTIELESVNLCSGRSDRLNALKFTDWSRRSCKFIRSGNPITLPSA
jgi:hypothetical protein